VSEARQKALKAAIKKTETFSKEQIKIVRAIVREEIAKAAQPTALTKKQIRKQERLRKKMREIGRLFWKKRAIFDFTKPDATKPDFAKPFCGSAKSDAERVFREKLEAISPFQGAFRSGQAI
jgi:hypothetical protein